MFFLPLPLPLELSGHKFSGIYFSSFKKSFFFLLVARPLQFTQ